MNVTKTAKKVAAGIGKMLTGDPVPEQLRDEAAKLKLTGTRTQVWTAACDAAKRSDAVLADYKLKARAFADEADKIKVGKMWLGNAQHAAAESAMNDARNQIDYAKLCEAFVKAIAPDELRDEYRSFHKRIDKATQQRKQILSDLTDLQRRVDEATRQKNHRDSVISHLVGDQKITAEVDARSAERVLKSADNEMKLRRDELDDAQKQITQLGDREAKVKRELYQLDK